MATRYCDFALADVAIWAPSSEEPSLAQNLVQQSYYLAGKSQGTDMGESHQAEKVGTHAACRVRHL